MARNPDRWHRRLLTALGLAYPKGGEPLSDAPKRSRYGLHVSPRLDQDVDELRQRLAELERRAR